MTHSDQKPQPTLSLVNIAECKNSARNNRAEEVNPDRNGRANTSGRAMSAFKNPEDEENTHDESYNTS